MEGSAWWYPELWLSLCAPSHWKCMWSRITHICCTSWITSNGHRLGGEILEQETETKMKGEWKKKKKVKTEWCEGYAITDLWITDEEKQQIHGRMWKFPAPCSGGWRESGHSKIKDPVYSPCWLAALNIWAVISQSVSCSVHYLWETSAKIALVFPKIRLRKKTFLFCWCFHPMLLQNQTKIILPQLGL